ncbi:RHS repeat-associated core domain-containing protein [Pseudomonas putida]|uniref:Teneurin-like YD-shell domain-containing protein n=1 Tax=Pseudomonas fluorescens TaxID=294 RepID=A0A5E6R4P4_PSEFL|nr:MULTISPECIES: RHS repeat-associated core domain-containing protein [Pseudomonas]VVM63166.1 hypothetical protein PS652_01392 [Pseudomonas fluorescens]
MAHTALDLNVGQDGKYEIFTNGKFNGEYIGPSIATTAIDGDFEIRKKYSRDGEQIPITIKNCNAYKVSITQLEVPVLQSLEHTQEKGKSTTTQKNASEGWASTTTLSLRGRLLNATDCLGNETHYSYDDYVRCTLADSPAASNSFIYSGDKLTQEVIEDKSTSTRLTVDYEYDKRDREVRRSFSCDGFPTIVLSRDYDVLGRVVQSELIKDGLPLRKETFNYNARGQLIGYGCEGEARPVTPWGKVLTEQYFAYDELGNMVTCATVTDEGTYTTAYRYGTIDRTQLESQTSEGDSSPPAVSYTYDKQGRLIKTLEGDQQSIYAYNRIGKLAKCSRQVLADGSVSDRDDFAYVYARSGELIAQTGDGSTDYIFCGQRRVGRRSSNSHMLLLNNSPSALLQRHARGNAEPHHSFELCDAQGSLVASFDLSSKELNTFAYTPFGYRPTDANDTHWLGFNGEALDTYNKGIYHLGEGYRMYDPRHQRFMAPDSESPFGMGGSNAYAYCLNDPVNFSDPTGHVPITYQSSKYLFLPSTLHPIYRAVVFGSIGIALAPFTGGASLGWTAAVVGLAIASAAFDIAAAATEKSNPELSAWLRGAGIVTGIASGGAAIFGVKLAARILPRLAMARGALATGSEARAVDLGNLHKSVLATKVPDPKKYMRWYQETKTGGRQGDRHFWGVNTKINGDDLDVPITQIKRRNSASDVHFYTGGHGEGSGHGNNWLDAAGGGVTRNPQLDQSAFFRQDMVRLASKGNPFPNKRAIYVHELDSTTPIPMLESWENQSGHHIMAYCFSRNDERFLSVYNKLPVRSYID